MDLEALKEDIRCAMDGLGGSEIARAAACVAMEDLEPAQGVKLGLGSNCVVWLSHR